MNLQARKLHKVIQGLRNGAYKNIVMLTGAGISCDSGIPDFRSPGGLYATLNPSLLTATDAQKRYLEGYPVGIVDIDLFRVNQFPYLEVRRPFILGTFENRWKPTIAHLFAKILDERGLLKRVYDQNIDGLYHAIGMRPPKLVKLHGSLAEVACEFCSTPYPPEEFCREVRKNIRNIYDENDREAPLMSSNIKCPKCRRPGVKPATVLFGRPLQPQVYETMRKDFHEERSTIDLMIISGTTLQVSPACNLVEWTNPGIPRILINNERVGLNVGLDFSSENNLDIHIESSCDQGFLDFAQQLQWFGDVAKRKDELCQKSQQLLSVQ
jgi:NAD-dependent SIR2 family protein deacetylase